MYLIEYLFFSVKKKREISGARPPIDSWWFHPDILKRMLSFLYAYPEVIFLSIDMESRT